MPNIGQPLAENVLVLDLLFVAGYKFNRLVRPYATLCFCTLCVNLIKTTREINCFVELPQFFIVPSGAHVTLPSNLFWF